MRGSCLCGSVAFEIAGPVAGPIVNCHCSRCRKARAAAHASNLFVDRTRAPGTEAYSPMGWRRRFGISPYGQRGTSMIGRTSTEPYFASGIFAAYSRASSRFAQSRM